MNQQTYLLPAVQIANAVVKRMCVCVYVTQILCSHCTSAVSFYSEPDKNKFTVKQ